MAREISVTIDESQYEYFESVVEDTEFDDVEAYLQRLLAEYHSYHTSNKVVEAEEDSADRDLDSHLEALGYK